MLDIQKYISKYSYWIWFFPIVLFIFPFRSKAADVENSIPKLKKPLSKSGMPYTPTGPFRSPFANPDYGEPAKVRVGFLLKSITNYNMKEGRFEADFFLSYTSDKPMPEGIKPHFTNGILEEDDLMQQIQTSLLLNFGNIMQFFLVFQIYEIFLLTSKN